MFIKKKGKSHSSKSNNFQAVVLTQSELRAVNGGRNHIDFRPKF